MCRRELLARRCSAVELVSDGHVECHLLEAVVAEVVAAEHLLLATVETACQAFGETPPAQTLDVGAAAGEMLLGWLAFALG